MPDTAPRPETLYGSTAARRVTVRDLLQAKQAGDRWPMLTAYDYSTARVFDEAGVPVLLVGDSAANVVYGYDSTVPVSIEELLPLARAVVRGAQRALVIADLPFGSYETSPAQAFQTAVRFLKDGGAQAVKLEGGVRVAEQVQLLTSSGIPVMGHIGLTPQSIHTMSGYRVQGRGNDAQRLIDDALALQAAGAFAVVLEVVPADLAKEITHLLQIPVVGIGAGVDTDAQVLVWQDFAGLRAGGTPAKFVKQYADLNAVLTEAVQRFAAEVQAGTYPGPEHTYL